MEIYRIENEHTMNGMWYDADGKYNPFIFNLTDGKSKDLPMKEDPKYSLHGIKWYCGCESIESLKEWFSKQDIEELYENGYKLYKMNIAQYVVEENQVLFTRQGLVSKQEIDPSTIWDM